MGIRQPHSPGPLRADYSATDLIAAAPLMLETLKTLLCRGHQLGLDGHDGLYGGPAEPITTVCRTDSCERARIVVAKALGYGNDH